MAFEQIQALAVGRAWRRHHQWTGPGVGDLTPVMTGDLTPGFDALEQRLDLAA
jgi:hypothetical protein